MKLHELKLQENENYEPFLTDHDEIHRFMNTIGGLNKKFYEIDHEGVVDVHTNIDMSNRLKGYDRLPVKFGVVGGNFECRNGDLNTLEGAPRRVKGYFNCTRNNIKTIDYMPRLIGGDLIFGQNDITSLVGIEKIIKKMNGILTFSTHDIVKGGIGLMMIPGIKYIDNLTVHRTVPFTIINKYLGKPDELFDCQAELIEHGFEEYAIL